MRLGMTFRVLLTCSALALLGSASHAAEPIVIGALGPFSGPGSSNGIDLRQGWEFAIDEVNKAGGLEVAGSRRPIKVIFEDSQARPEVGLGAAQKLLMRDNVEVLVGDMFNSSVTLAIMDLASESKRVMLTGNPVSQEIAKKIASDKTKYADIWKFMFNADAFAQTTFATVTGLIEQKLVSAPNKTILHLSEETDYGKSQVEMLNAVFKPAGWTIVGTEFIPSGTSDFYPQLAKVRALKPDLIISSITALNSGAALVKQMKEQAVPGLHFGIFYPSRPEFLKAAGTAAEGLVHSPLFFDPVSNPKHKELNDKLHPFVKKDVSTSHVFGYCNALVLMDAIKRAGTTEYKKLSAAMADTDFSCTIGRWKFNPADHSPVMGADFLAVPAGQIQDGKWRAIWPESVATAKYRP